MTRKSCLALTTFNDNLGSLVSRHQIPNPYLGAHENKKTTISMPFPQLFS